MSNIPEYKDILDEAKKHCDDRGSRGDANLMQQCVSNVLRAMRLEMEILKACEDKSQLLAQNQKDSAYQRQLQLASLNIPEKQKMELISKCNW